MEDTMVHQAKGPQREITLLGRKLNDAKEAVMSEWATRVDEVRHLAKLSA